MGLGASPAPELIRGLCHRGPKNSSLWDCEGRSPLSPPQHGLGCEFSHLCGGPFDLVHVSVDNLEYLQGNSISK